MPRLQRHTLTTDETDNTDKKRGFAASLFLFEFVNGDAELTASMLDGLLHQRLALRTRHVPNFVRKELATTGTDGIGYLLEGFYRRIASYHVGE